MMHRSVLLRGAGVLAAVTILTSTSARAADKVDFAKQIFPVLQKTCFECHGPEKKKGGLRLHSKEEAFKEDYVIVPGKSSESEVYKRIILPSDDDDVMPPEGGPLAKEMIELIKKWIDEGAVWPEGLAAKEEKAAPGPFAGMKAVEPDAAEKKAVAELEKLGVSVRAIAQNVPWTQANFRSLEGASADKAMDLLKDVKTLSDLNLAGTDLTDAGAKNLAALPNLTRLHLEHTKVTDAALKNLAGHKHLYYLNLFDTAVTDGGLASLEKLPALKKLYLWQTKVTKEKAQAFGKAKPGLEVVMGWEPVQVAKKEEPEEKKEPAKPEPKKEAPKKKEKAAPKKAEAKKDDKPAAKEEEKKDEKKK